MENKKQFFLIDFDNTAVDTRMAHCLYLNHVYGIDSVPEDFVNNASLEAVIKKYDSNSNITDTEALTHLGEYFHTSYDWHKEVMPIDEHVVEILAELSKKYNMVLATARPDSSNEIVRYLLEMHFPKCIEQIHFVHKRLGYGKWDKIPKREFVQSIGPESFVAFIDDSTKEIREMQDVIQSYLFDPWFLHTDVNDIKNRVPNWKKVGNLYL